jgi:hypothetical protein
VSGPHVSLINLLTEVTPPACNSCSTRSAAKRTAMQRDSRSPSDWQMCSSRNRGLRRTGRFVIPDVTFGGSGRMTGSSGSRQRCGKASPATSSRDTSVRVLCGVVIPSPTIRRSLFKVQVHNRETSTALQHRPLHMAPHLRLAVFSCVEDVFNDRLGCTFQLAARAEWCQPQRHGWAGRQLWNRYR